MVNNPSDTALRQVAQLRDMTIHDLKSLWFECFGSPPNTHVRSFIEKRLAYQLQVNALDKKGKALIKNNTQRIEEKKQQLESTSGKPTITIPGTILRRLYKGEEHEVVVLADGQFEYNGRPYGSLSEIAREITGTRWSGPLFFGLRQPKKKGAHQ